MVKSALYQPRLYRESMGNARWRTFTVSFRETDLWVAVDAGSYIRPIESFTTSRIRFYREILDEHISIRPEFRDSLVPIGSDKDLPNLVDAMYKASEIAGTGPMSAVAGAIAECICNDLSSEFGLKEAVVENGGDIFMKIIAPVTISVYAGSSPLSEKINLIIKPDDTPVSVCCSSGTAGHSLSFGVADACMIACRSGALADAYATAFCNRVKSIDMVQQVTELALVESEIISVVIIMADRVGIGGKMEIKLR